MTQATIHRQRIRVAISLCVLLAAIAGTVGCNSQNKATDTPVATSGTAAGATATGPKGPTTAGPVQNVNGQKVQKGPATDP